MMLSVRGSQASRYQESHIIPVTIAEPPDSFPRDSDSAGPVQGWRLFCVAFALVKISGIVQNSKSYKLECSEKQSSFLPLSPSHSVSLPDATYFLYWIYALTINAYISMYKYT